MFGEVHVAPADVKEAEKIVGDMFIQGCPTKETRRDVRKGSLQKSHERWQR